MSTEEVHATQVSDKDAMTERPEVDEDARTESSEGSNTQQQWAPDAADSEDEFEDARAPSSTSSMLLVFDGSAPPLSGVYEDALEATEQQVAAALGSTSSDGGRQPMILEGDEEEEVENVMETEDAAETEVMAVVEGIVEAAVAAVVEDVAAPSEEDAPTHDDDVPVEEDLAVDTSEEVVAEELGSSEEADFEVAVGEDADEYAAIDQTQGEDTNEAVSEETSEEEKVAAGRLKVEEVDFAEVTAKERTERGDVEQAVEAVNNATEQTVDGEPVDEANADDKEVKSTVINETERQKAAETGTSAAVETTESESPVAGVTGIACEEEVVAEVAESEDVIKEDAADEQADGIEDSVEMTIPAADSANGNVEMATGEETADAEPAALETIADVVPEQTAMDTSETTNHPAQKCEEAAEEAHEPETSDEVGPVVVEETTTDELIKHDGDEAPVEEAIAVDAAEEIATEDVVIEKAVAEEVAQEEPIASTEKAAVSADDVVDEAELKGQGLLQELDETTQLEESTSEEAPAAEDVEEIVIQVANDLVEAVQSEQDTDQVEEIVEAEACHPEATVEEALDEKPDVRVTTEKHDAEGVTDAPEQDNEAASPDNSPVEEDRVGNNAEYLATDAQASDITPEQVPSEEEAKAEAAPLNSAAEPAPKPTGAYRKSGDADEQSHVVLGLLPSLGPSSGATTTTTIEPFILSTESVEVHLPPQRWIYEVYGFSIENRVVYYHIHKTDRRTGICDPPILKRYTDFRELQLQLLDTCLHAAADMPRIPRPHLGTVFRGYKSKKTIEVREKAFRALLRYISQYPTLHGSGVFERFIETRRATPGAGWM